MDLPHSPLLSPGGNDASLVIDQVPLKLSAQLILQQGLAAMARAAKTYALVYDEQGLLGVFTYVNAAQASVNGANFQREILGAWLTSLETLETCPELTEEPGGQISPNPDYDYWPVVNSSQHWIGFLTPTGEYKVCLATLQPTERGTQVLSPSPPQGRLDQEHFTLALKGAQMGTWEWHLPSHSLVLSPESEQLLEMAPGEFDGHYETLFHHIHPDDRSLVDQTLQQAIHQGERYDVDFRVVQPDGKVRWLLSQGQGFYHGSGITRLVGVNLDISEQKQTETELRLQAQRERLVAQIAQRIRALLDLDHILEQTVILVKQFIEADRVIILQCTPDMSGQVTQEACNPGYPTMMGWSLRDPWTVEEKFLAHYRRGRGLAVANIYDQGLAEDQLLFLEYFQIQAEIVVPLLQEESLWGLLIAHQCDAPRQWRTADVRLLQSLAVQVGIAIHQAKLHQRLTLANQKLKRIAYLDGLTQVANRRRFEQHLESEWRRMARQQTFLAIILADIDYFKGFNDLYGHQAGDNCLRLVARTLSRAARRPGDLVARYGGEEFAVILPGADLQGAETVAEDLRRSIRDLRVAHQGSNIDRIVTMSLGVASCIPSAKGNPASLLKQADAALYAAKHGGRDQVRASP